LFRRVYAMLPAQRINVLANARLASMLPQKLLQPLTRKGKQSSEDEINGSGCAFDVQQNRLNRISAGWHGQR
jgi:hypothetical protein